MQQGKKIFTEYHFYTTKPERHVMFRVWLVQNPELWKIFKMTLCNLPLFCPVHLSHEQPGKDQSLAALDFTSITSHIHNWVLFLLWLHLFILSGVISPLISSNILSTYRLGEFIFQCPMLLPFHTVHGVPRQEHWSGLPFPFLVDQILSELSTMTCLSWVTLAWLIVSLS